MSEERKTKTDAAAPASAALERIDRKDAFLQALHTFLTAHQGTEWAVAAVDIQHFKLYNELYGTEKGDVLLETMANCLLGYSKQTGYPVGYFGNDDFFLCLPDEKAEQTVVLATLQACMAAGRQDVTFFVVMGVCPVQANPGADAATLCNYAQIAGVTTNNGYLHRFEPTMLNELKEQQLLLGELERALDNHEFCFFLQPKCNSITRAIVGMEALVRWMAPILSFTADEVWGYLPGEREKYVFTGEWYEGLFGLADSEAMNDAFWDELLKVRGEVNKVIEQARADKKVGGSLEAAVTLYAEPELAAKLTALGDELRFVLLTSGATVADYNDAPADAQQSEVLKGLKVALSKAEGEKCPRCWHYTQDVGKVAEHAEICGRCVSNVAGDGEKRKFA